jgi:hypothetical protein
LPVILRVAARATVPKGKLTAIMIAVWLIHFKQFVIVHRKDAKLAKVLLESKEREFLKDFVILLEKDNLL